MGASCIPQQIQIVMISNGLLPTVTDSYGHLLYRLLLMSILLSSAAYSLSDEQQLPVTGCCNELRNQHLEPM